MSPVRVVVPIGFTELVYIPKYVIPFTFPYVVTSSFCAIFKLFPCNIYILLSTFVVNTSLPSISVDVSILAVSNVSVPSAFINILEYSFNKLAPLSKYIVELFANFRCPISLNANFIVLY